MRDSSTAGAENEITASHVGCPSPSQCLSELSPQPMIAVEGATHTVRNLNIAFAHFVGKERTELIGRPFAEAVPDGAENGCHALLDQVYRTGIPETLEEQQHSKMPPIYWSYSAWPIFEANERPAGVMIQVTDTTEMALFRKQVVAMNEQLLIAVTRQHELTEKAEKANQTTEIAEKANAAKDEFLSRMSHELRTPLNAILGFGQILEMEQERLTALDNESVQHILKAGRHLLDLVNEVLDITRIQAPDSTLSLEPVALDEVVHEALNMLQPMAASAGIAIPKGLDGAQSAAKPLILVLADRQRVLQIVLNLLANAIKYNKCNGQVTVSFEVLPENRVLLHISDTGYGIAAEDLSRLFVPFSRLNAERLGIEGTGLGLVLCQRLATAMNGSIQVESQPGVGSTFSLELPLAESLAQLSVPAENIDTSQYSLSVPSSPGADRSI